MPLLDQELYFIIQHATIIYVISMISMEMTILVLIPFVEAQLHSLGLFDWILILYLHQDVGSLLDKRCVAFIIVAR